MLKVKKSGLYVSEYKKKTVKVHSYIPYLNSIIKLDDDITFEDFFKYIMKDTKNYSMVFSSHLGHYDLSEWKDEWKTFAETIDLDYIYLKWVAEYTDWSKRLGKHSFAGIDYEITNTNKEIEIRVDFSGWGKEPKDVHANYAIEMTPLNELKLLPFKLDENFQLFELRESRTLVGGTREFTVYDVIGAVLYEISFAGAPEERDKEMSKIKESLKQIEKGNFTEYKFEKN